MIRKIIEIDREKCDGCGLCAKACHEGAIGIIDGKAELCGMITATGWGLSAGLPARRHTLC